MVAVLAFLVASSANAGNCRLMMGDDPGVGCCNACCDTFQSDMVWCKILRWICRSCGEACASEAWNTYLRCALQCAIDWPEYIDRCEYDG